MLQGKQTLGVRQAEGRQSQWVLGRTLPEVKLPGSYLPRTGRVLLILHISKVQHTLESYPRHPCVEDSALQLGFLQICA